MAKQPKTKELEADINEIVGDLLYGDTEAPSSEGEDTGNEDSATDDVPETEQPSPDPDQKDDEEESAEKEESDSEDGDGEGPQEASGEEDKDVVVEIDGEKFTLDELREWRQNGLRQADYSRKSQQREEQYREWQGKAEARDKLVNDMVADENLKSFLSVHPEAITYLLQDPDNARKLIGNPKEIQAFWDDYEVLTEHPGLAERFSREKPEEVTQAVMQQRLNDNVMAVANALDDAVDSIAAEFKDVDAEAVKSYVLQLGRYPTSENPDPEEVVNAFDRMFQLFFVQSEEGWVVDPTLIRNEFGRMDTIRKYSAPNEPDEAEAHNKAVDEQLKDTPPPSTGSKRGGAPGVKDEPLPKGGTLDEIIGSLLYGEDA